MGTLYTGVIIVTLLLIIVGGIGLFFTFTNFPLGSPHLVQGGLTYGTFSSVGLLMLILLIIAGPEF